MQRPGVGEDGGPGTAGGIDGQIGDRDAGPVDQRHGQTDRQRRKALRRAAIRGPQNDEHEQAGEHHFGTEARQQRIARRRMLAVAVGGEAAGDEAGPPAGNR